MKLSESRFMKRSKQTLERALGEANQKFKRLMDLERGLLRELRIKKVVVRIDPEAAKTQRLSR